MKPVSSKAHKANSSCLICNVSDNFPLKYLRFGGLAIKVMGFGEQGFSLLRCEGIEHF